MRHFLVDGVARRFQFGIFPPHCLLCGLGGASQRDLCDGCERDLARNDLACPICALPLTVAAPMCGECLRHPAPFETTIAPFLYGYPIDGLVTRLKFSRQLAAGRVLSQLWLDRFDALVSVPNAIVPVPLHATRLRERGFNQASELARPIAKSLGIDLREHALVRTRATPAQSDLDAVQRRKNLRNAFEVVSELPEYVAIVDDVMTTGTTVRECARALRRAGVQRVDVWVIARAPK